MLETEKKKIEFINKALEKGENSGEPRPFDNEAFKKRMKQKHSADA
jgi:Arc/MetJ-type ribon-helix-helix transcriptional regulator